MAKINIDWNEVYRDRLERIEIEIKIAIRKKHWGLKKILEDEKVRINKILDEPKTKEGNKLE